MTYSDTVKILNILKTAYPRFYANIDDRELRDTASLWSELFVNDDVTLVVATVKELINSFQFPPTIADIKAKMNKITDTEHKQAIDYWNELKKLVANGTYGAIEGFNNASEPLKRFLHNPSQIKELAQMDEETFNSVTKGQFLKQIENILTEEKEQRAMLPDTKALIQNLANNLSLENKIPEIKMLDNETFDD